MSAPIDNGGPAFPVAYGDGRIEGMHLRDYFAAKAMQGVMANSATTGDGLQRAMKLAGVDHAQDWFARIAYEVADAMLKAREQ